MITFSYQGQELTGERVNSMDGDLPIVIREDCMVRHHGFEELLRDKEGHYYLRRHLQVCDVDGTTEHEASGRTRVHRISLTAAVQWAIMRCEAETNHLRRDVAAALAERSVAASPLDPDEVTVPFTLPLELYRSILAMGAYDELDGFDATVIRSMEGDVEAWLESSDQRKPHQFLRRYERELDAGLHPDVYPPQSHAANNKPGESRESVLDLLDANLGLQVLRYLHLSPWNYTSADVVNGCVEYALQHVFEALEKLHKGKVPDDEGFTDDGWGYVEERICAAAHRRNGDQPVEQKSAENGRIARLDAPPRTHTVRLEGLGEHGEPIEVELSGEAVAMIQEHARKHDLNFAGAFLAMFTQALTRFEKHLSLPATAAQAADRSDLALCAAGAVEPLPDDGPSTEEELPDIEEDDREPWAQAQPEQEGGK